MFVSNVRPKKLPEEIYLDAYRAATNPQKELQAQLSAQKSAAQNLYMRMIEQGPCVRQLAVFANEPTDSDYFAQVQVHKDATSSSFAALRDMYLPQRNEASAITRPAPLSLKLSFVRVPPEPTFAFPSSFILAAPLLAAPNATSKNESKAKQSASLASEQTREKTVTVLNAAFRIRKFVQSFGTTDPSDDGKPQMLCSEETLIEDPNPYYNQTKQGLFLEVSMGNIPKKIHTPCGSLRIMASSSGDWTKVFSDLKESLGLKLIEESWRDKSGNCHPSLWAITKWEGKMLEEPVYRKRDEYISAEIAEKEWNEIKKIAADRQIWNLAGDALKEIAGKMGGTHPG